MRRDNTMRRTSLLWILALVVLTGSISLFADDERDRNGPSRRGREAVPVEDRNYPDRNRAPEKDAWQDRQEREKEMREADREREKEWREYLKERKKAYKEWFRADRREQDDFERYRRDRRGDRGDRSDRSDRGDERWDGNGNWGGRNEPRDGVCFYTDAYYRGESFCVDRNERRGFVGEHYNDRISSIRVFGRSARIVVYEHHYFGGARRTFTGDVAHLGNFNDKISSIEVR